MAKSDEQESSGTTDLGERATALAEQLGRIVGTIEGTTDSWLSRSTANRQALAEQLTRLRDNASRMLETLSSGASESGKVVADRAREAASAADSAMASFKALGERVRAKTGQSKKKAKRAAAATRKMGDAAHAPGKRHRKPAPSAKGVKKSDERIAKTRGAKAVRQRRKSYA